MKRVVVGDVILLSAGAVVRFLPETMGVINDITCGEYVVYESGWAAGGMCDGAAYPCGWRVRCRRLDDKPYCVEFFQPDEQGRKLHTPMIDDVSVVGSAKCVWVRQ